MLSLIWHAFVIWYTIYYKHIQILLLSYKQIQISIILYSKKFIYYD